MDYGRRQRDRQLETPLIAEEIEATIIAGDGAIDKLNVADDVKTEAKKMLRRVLEVALSGGKFLAIGP